MPALTLLPVGDWRNEGWDIVGATNLYSAWNNDNDAIYAKCPASKGGGTVTFPIDYSSVPDGAVVTSITVSLRVARVGATVRPVTVNIISADDESRYHTKTFHPGTTATTYEVGTFTRDPRGESWDIHRINKMRFRVFAYHKVYDTIRAYKFFAQVNYKLRPTLTVEAPAGTVYSPSPTLSWTYSQSEGDAQGRVDYKVYTSVQTQESSFNPDYTPPVFVGSVIGEVSSLILPTSLDPDSYIVYARAESVFGAKSLWVSRAFTVQGPSPAIPGNDNAGAGGTPGVGVPTVVLNSATSSALVTFRDSSNLLPLQSGDIENLQDGGGYVTTNCAASRDATIWYGVGQACMKLTASSAATMSATSNDVEIAELTPVTARVQVRSAVTARTVNLRILFYDELFASLGSTISNSGTDATTTWTEITCTGTSPAGTVYAKVQIEVVSPANAEVHYVDHVGLMYGTGSAWSSGGFMSRNLLSSYNATGDDPVNSGMGWVAGNSASTVSRVATFGTGSNGTMTNRMVYNGATPTIAYRATGTTFNSATSGTDFTINKPAGLADGDLMIAYLTAAGTGTLTIPTGWSLVDSTSADGNHSLWVLKRTGLAADPSTWTVTLSASTNRRTCAVVAYSGAADVSSQFAAENVRSDADGAFVHTSAVVNNPEAAAWRASCFAWRDGVAGGTAVANITPPSYTTPIQYVGRATKWSMQGDTTSYTINRPTGVVSGDLMIAVATFSGSITTVTAPSGWTLVRKTTQTDPTGPCTFAVFKRTAGSSEPTSWSGTLSSSSRPTITQCVAYRNCKNASLQFLDENTSVSASGSDITTATVANTVSNSWRITALGMVTDPVTNFDGSSEVIERVNGSQLGYPNDVAAAIYDSNGPVSTGSHARTGSSPQDWYAAVSWVGIIAALDTPPAAGSNETERVDFTTGAADPWATLAVYDSGAVVPSGLTSVTGVFTPGSGTSADSALSWIGIIRPGVAVTAGTVAAYTSDKVDISLIDPRVLEMAGNKVTMTASFYGSVAGTPYLTVDFYRANVWIATQTAEGTAFNTSYWVKSAATFDIPPGTTRMRPQVSSRDRAATDTIGFDKIGLSLGSSVVWRDGTGQAEHPVWALPEIQYAENDGTGYGEWTTVPGSTTNPPQFDLLTGLVTFKDDTVTPQRPRKYRVQTRAYGLAGDRFVSGWGPASAEVELVADTWWLKDVSDPTRNLAIRVVGSPEPDIGTTNTATVFQPLGSDYPKVVTGGFKADTIPLDIIVEQDENVALNRLLKSGKTLFLQSDVDRCWWVRPVGDLKHPIQNSDTRKTDPVRIISITFVEVEPEG